MQLVGAGGSCPLPSEVGSSILPAGEPVEKSPAAKGIGRSIESPGPPDSMEFLMQPMNRLESARFSPLVCMDLD